MNAVAQLDALRSAARQIVEKACELEGLAAPLPGLGVAITEATERIYGALAHGGPIAAPSFTLVGAWEAAGWPVDSIFQMLDRIYDRANEAREALCV